MDGSQYFHFLNIPHLILPVQHFPVSLLLLDLFLVFCFWLWSLQVQPWYAATSQFSALCSVPTELHIHFLIKFFSIFLSKHDDWHSKKYFGILVLQNHCVFRDVWAFKLIIKVRFSVNNARCHCCSCCFAVVCVVAASRPPAAELRHQRSHKPQPATHRKPFSCDGRHLRWR